MKRLILYAIGLALSWHATAQAGLIVNLPMNEPTWTGSPPQVVDTTGNGHAGTVIGGANTVFDSTLGQQVGSFNGNGQYVALGGAGSVSGARSVVAWVNVQANSLTLGQPILTGGATNQGDFFAIAGTGGENSGVLHYALFVDHWSTQAYRSTGTITPNTWTQVALTYNGSNTVNFYINGLPSGTVVSNGLYNYNINTYDVGGNTIGGNTTNASFNGRIGGLAVYNNELTPSQVLTLSQTTSVPEPSSLILTALAASSMAAFIWRRRQKTMEKSVALTAA